jgi:hypothetical protein
MTLNLSKSERGRWKTEPAYVGGYIARRYAGRGRHGGVTLAERDEADIAFAEHELTLAREALAEAHALPEGTYRTARRREVHERLALVGRHLCSLAHGRRAERETQPEGITLRRTNVAEIGPTLALDASVYTGADGVTPAHVDALRAGLRARGLDLGRVGPQWFRVVERNDAIPQPAGRCSACAGTVWLGRCRRCGTRSAT